MIKLCIADSAPVIAFGIHSYFKNHADIACVSIAKNTEQLLQELQFKEIQLVLLDLELDGFTSLRDLKSLLVDYPQLKIILFTNAAEKVYAEAVIKLGATAFISKKTALNIIEETLLRAAEGSLYQKNIKTTGAQEKKSERLYKKISNREIEVLRHLNTGKKNKEIANILEIDEKTISTYKLRLLTKLNVTNLVDLLQKAKDLEII
ncbi:LuxR C-terminal-related transcriptional regulator [Flavobacterium sp.]|jgi:DNA-binding NarL/FixJ family response regulator|uniref:LuxR C-terminal-related transcriptional regulator n=1 Tax=Flavobacterium sp. TaxID=239 RepID=UPI0037C11E4D